ncbi:MAG TPA: S24 family peptidase [Burkholderiaceae bacterium]|nr:S24 family peptidase [Burkholderiaceae bacterium]
MAKAKKAATRTKAKKAATSTKAKVGAAKPRKARWNERRERQEFQAGFREKLLEVLAASSIPERGVGSFLSQVTHRSKQATTRWLQTGRASGIPDVIALRQLSLAFNLDPAYLMGLSRLPRRAGAWTKGNEAASKAWEDWQRKVDEALPRRPAGMEALIIEGDEMEPTIGAGALVFVNPQLTTVSSSGLYAIESAGRIAVRMIEARIGGGVVIRCDNPRYPKQLSVAKEADLKRHSTRIVGRVEGWLDARWR